MASVPWYSFPTVMPNLHKFGGKLQASHTQRLCLIPNAVQQNVVHMKTARNKKVVQIKYLLGQRPRDQGALSSKWAHLGMDISNWAARNITCISESFPFTRMHASLRQGLIASAEHHASPCIITRFTWSYSITGSLIRMKRSTFVLSSDIPFSSFSPCTAPGFLSLSKLRVVAFLSESWYRRSNMWCSLLSVDSSLQLICFW